MNANGTLGQKHKYLWLIVSFISLAIFSSIVVMWDIVNDSYLPNTQQITTEQEARKVNTLKAPNAAKQTLEIPTGIYLQSLHFVSAYDVHVSGTLWQTLPNEMQIDSPQLYFSEQVNGTMNPTLRYKVRKGDSTTYGWSFEVTVRQPFDYSVYPLDHKTVWLRILPNNIGTEVLLLPDLSSFPSTDLGDIFGLDDQIVLGNWTVDETFFDYKLNSYATNFGFMSVTEHQQRELHFNVVLKRKFVNAFVVHLVPMLTVAVLLFAILLNFSHCKTTASNNGFSKMNSIGAISALFFIVVISHVDVRTKFPSGGLIYIEYFYLIMYSTMTWIVMASFVEYREGRFLSKILANDSLILKLMYWPVLLSIIAIVTYCVLF